MKRMSSGRASLLALALLTVAGLPARADTPGDAWAVARGMVPANTQILVGLNINTIKTSQVFQTVWAQALAQSGDAKDELEKLKQTCGIDLKDALQGFVAAVDESQKGAIFVSLKGVDQKKALDCMNKAGEKEKKSFSATSADAQGIIEYTEKGAKDKLYVAWLPKGVVAVATEPEDKALLQKWISGKGPDSKVTATLSKVNSGAAIWGVVAKEQELEPGMNMKAGYGNADITGGNITADIRIILANAKQAADAAAKGQKELAQAQAAGGMPPALQSILKTVKIGAQGDEIQVKASMPEKDAISLLGMAMGGGGGPPK
jgi:hypothetical protein